MFTRTACLIFLLASLSSGRPVLDASREVHREMEAIGRDIDQGTRTKSSLSCDVCQELASIHTRKANVEFNVETTVNDFCMTLQYEGYTSPSHDDCFHTVMQEMLAKDTGEQDDYRLADLICIYYGSCTIV